MDDKLSWQDQLREFLSEVSSTYRLPSVQDLFGDMEHLSEGVYITSDGPVELNRSVH